MKVFLAAVLAVSAVSVPARLLRPSPLRCHDKRGHAARPRSDRAADSATTQGRDVGRQAVACCPESRGSRFRWCLVRRDHAEVGDRTRAAGPRGRRTGHGCADCRRTGAGCGAGPAQGRCRQVGRQGMPDAVSGWAADPRTGSVVINVQAGKRSEAVDAFVAKVAKAGAVTVREVAAQAPKTFAAGTVGGDPYYTGNVRCSIGFSVYGGFVTAGHCGGGRRGPRLGRLRHRQLPGIVVPRQRLRLGQRRQRLVDRPGGPGLGHRLATSWSAAREAPVGASICRSGSTTALALRQCPGQERDRQLQPGRGPPDDQDQRLRRAAATPAARSSAATRRRASPPVAGATAAAVARPGTSPSTRSSAGTA